MQDRPVMPSQFSGDSKNPNAVRTFIREVEVYFRMVNVADDAGLEHTLGWEGFKQKLMSQYSSLTELEDARKLYFSLMHWNQSIEKYLEDFQMAFMTIRSEIYTEVQAIERYLTGLKACTQNDLRKEKFSTLADIIVEAIRHEWINSAVYKKKDSKGTYELNAVQASDKKGLRCYHCKQQGHFKKECPNCKSNDDADKDGKSGKGNARPTN